MVKKLIAACLVAAVCGAGLAAAEMNTYSFGYEVLKDGPGRLTLRLTTEVAADGMWLGVTLYPPGVKDIAKEAKSQVLPVKEGRGITEVPIGPAFKNGTFEAAVWTKKGPCPPADEVCKKRGYQVTGMTSYIWGYLEAR